MIYVIAGNGNPNKREVTKTLASLIEDKDVAFVLTAYEDPSPATQAILSFLNNTGLYYLVTVPKGTALEDLQGTPYALASETIPAKRPIARALSLAAHDTDSADEWKLLVMSDDIDGDEEILYAISACVENGVDVFALGGQMTPLTFEEEDVPTEATPAPEPDPVSAPVQEALKLAETVSTHLDDLTREELEDLTRDELKSLAATKGVTPKDSRSKESIIDAILGVEGVPSLDDVNIVFEDPGKVKCYLLMIEGEEVSLLPITPEQYSQITF